MLAQAIDIANKNVLGSWAGGGRMHRFMVKIETAGIFKGVFEIQKSTRNEENFAKIRAWETRGS